MFVQKNFTPYIYYNPYNSKLLRLSGSLLIISQINKKFIKKVPSNRSLKKHTMDFILLKNLTI